MKQVVIGLLGTTLDRGKDPSRWEMWRPSVSLCQHDDLLVDRFELLHSKKYASMAETVARDIRSVSPETEVRLHCIEFSDPWDFQEVYGALHEFARSYPFEPEQEDYLVHITTGTHVAQICLFLLTESRHFPAKLIQSSPPNERSRQSDPHGRFDLIDLDLSRYDHLRLRFQDEQNEARVVLKSGIATRNRQFNQLIEEIEHVAVHSRDPMLIMGPTGAGKSQLARRIFELRKSRHQVNAAFVEVNCATIRGDGAMSALFGHVKGSFTGAIKDRPGLLRAANGGVLFLDEIGELGCDEQAMLLRALEERRFLPLGADQEVESDFQLIAGTNRDLSLAVERGEFREDLLARINLWTFRLPGLRERPEDIEPNLDYELEKYAQKNGTQVSIGKDLREEFLRFAQSPAAKWSANFRDLNASVTRMATLAGAGGRITRPILESELQRLRSSWARGSGFRKGSLDSAEDLASAHETILRTAFSPEALAEIDPFDQAQLALVIETCRCAASLSEAGRKLFAASRQKKANANDADRLRKYLARFGLTWQQCRQPL
jgi:transcriptional regulatory protein RtcR